MYIFDEISKILGEENLNLRLENLNLRKNPGEENIDQGLPKFIKGDLTIQANSNLVLLKLTILTKMVENFFENYFSKNNEKKLSKLNGNLPKNFHQDSNQKILKISILLKNLHSIFFRLRNIFFKYWIFLFSVRINIKKIKNFFKELLVIDLITHYGFQILAIFKNSNALNSGILKVVPFNVSLKKIYELKEKSIQKKWKGKISLKFVKNSKKKGKII